MENLKTKIISKIKEAKLVDFIYPSISILFLIISITLFTFSINFISKYINKALDEGAGSGSLLSLDKSNFEPIRVKFNIKIENILDRQGVTAAPATVTASSTILAEEKSPETNSEMPATSPEITPEEKNTLTISVLNSTKTIGLAATLKKALEEGGFIVSKTGNTELSNDTILKIKRGKEKFKETLMDIISAKYTVDIFEELSETDPYDVVLIIGKQD